MSLFFFSHNTKERDYEHNGKTRVLTQKVHTDARNVHLSILSCSLVPVNACSKSCYRETIFYFIIYIVTCVPLLQGICQLTAGGDFKCYSTVCLVLTFFSSCKRNCHSKQQKAGQDRSLRDQHKLKTGNKRQTFINEAAPRL